MIDFKQYILADAWVLWFLIAIPLLWILYYLFKNKRSNAVTTSSFQFLDGIQSTKISIQTVKYILRTISFIFLIIALARPQLKVEVTEGIDIMIAMDASGSMNAMDFEPNRFEAAKKVAQEFIQKREDDRIGLVLFEGEAYTQCPLTIDKTVLSEIIESTEQGVLDGETAIGMGLATAINRLREQKSKSKVVILLTDGVNNKGSIDPMTAAQFAVEFDIRVYTIGIGSNEKVKTPVAIHPITGEYIYDYVDVEIDEELLKKISSLTGGKYFRATDNQKLKEIYAEIDTLEKHLITSSMLSAHYPEKSMPFILIGLAFLMVEFLLSLLFKTIS